MIISFFDKDFKGLQDNASLVIDNQSYSLIRRGVELDELKCTCEPFTEDIQPTFLVVMDNRGRYVYSCLAGIPELTQERKTVITGTDLKSMFKSDVLLDYKNTTITSVNGLLRYTFDTWNMQVNQGSFDCELVFKRYGGEDWTVDFDYLRHTDKAIYNAWEDIFAPYLKYYGLYMTGRLDLINKKVVFEVGKSMRVDKNIRLWEHGLYDYGKQIADINETQGYVYRKDADSYIASPNRWILRSDNKITTDTEKRDIYPIKRRVVVVEATDQTEQTEKMLEADTNSLTLLCESMYNEDITLSGVKADFETKFNIWLRRGAEKEYKSLPCGELHYDTSGLKSIKIGYRFTGLQFLL